jgi:hypothetical protein
LPHGAGVLGRQRAVLPALTFGCGGLRGRFAGGVPFGLAFVLPGGLRSQRPGVFECGVGGVLRAAAGEGGLEHLEGLLLRVALRVGAGWLGLVTVLAVVVVVVGAGVRG